MDYLTHASRRTIDGRELSFIRCDSAGNVLSPEQLSALSLTNPTLESIVGEAARRISFSADCPALSFRSQ